MNPTRVRSPFRPIALLAIGLLFTGSSAARADITIDLGRGPVTVHVPDSYDPNVPAPLIVLLHGYTATGDWIKAYFDLDAMSEEHGFLYMAPDGTTDQWGFQFWNATDACCDFGYTGVDDSGYLRALVEEVQNKLNVAPRRIHFTGHSNGGFMSYRMACDHTDLVASMASLAGATWHDDDFCPRSEPAHVLQIHGTEDTAVLYGGGDTGAGLSNRPTHRADHAAVGGDGDAVIARTMPALRASRRTRCNQRPARHELLRSIRRSVNRSTVAPPRPASTCPSQSGDA